MNPKYTTMKDSQALVKPILLAVVCLCFVLLQTCQEKKQVTPEIVQQPVAVTFSPGK